MIRRLAFVSVLTALAALPATTSAQTGATPPAAPAALLAADQWRTVAPENLMVIDTSKGRVVVELDPKIAPAHVERLYLIRNYRASGIGLDDMRNLLGWTHRESPEPELLTQAVRDHLAYVEERMAQLTRVKEHLLALERQAVPSAAREICEERPGCGGS